MQAVLESLQCVHAADLYDVREHVQYRLVIVCILWQSNWPLSAENLSYDCSCGS